mmetsp:Transcript_2551/g.6377  ORF Transcript_2551/g.6377 Transcript_2551/m.6377 type:complete len:226 (-) Transcript_2551:1106-1783(-)
MELSTVRRASTRTTRDVREANFSRRRLSPLDRLPRFSDALRLFEQIHRRCVMPWILRGEWTCCFRRCRCAQRSRRSEGADLHSHYIAPLPRAHSHPYHTTIGRSYSDVVLRSLLRDCTGETNWEVCSRSRLGHLVLRRACIGRDSWNRHRRRTSVLGLRRQPRRDSSVPTAADGQIIWLRPRQICARRRDSCLLEVPLSPREHRRTAQGRSHRKRHCCDCHHFCF